MKSASSTKPNFRASMKGRIVVMPKIAAGRWFALVLLTVSIDEPAPYSATVFAQYQRVALSSP
jgi:hypothetical protein